MLFSRIAALFSVGALAQTYVGTLEPYTDTSDACTTVVPAIAASIAAAYWNTGNPCGETITVTDPDTGASVVATVVGNAGGALGILLTEDGLAALSPTGEADDAPAIVDWVFN